MTTETVTHTPAPWFIAEAVPAGGVVVRTDARSRPGGLIATVGGGPEGEANARLIASAPDLLAALEDIADRLHGLMDSLSEDDAYDSRDDDNQALVRAVAAIAKARGD